jgi:hypothetical protein
VTALLLSYKSEEKLGVSVSCLVDDRNAEIDPYRVCRVGRRHGEDPQLRCLQQPVFRYDRMEAALFSPIQRRVPAVLHRLVQRYQPPDVINRS